MMIEQRYRDCTIFCNRRVQNLLTKLVNVMTDGSAHFIANATNTKRRGNIYMHVEGNQLLGKERAEKLLYLT